MRVRAERSRNRRPARALAAAVATALLLGASGTQAVPLFFPLGGAQTGFVDTATAQSLGVVWQVGMNATTLCTGADPFPTMPMGSCMGKSSFDVTITIPTGPLQNIENNPYTGGGTPTPGDPFVALSNWTARNTSGADFDRPVVLIFTGVDVSSYPDIETGLDSDFFDILRFTTGGGDELYYGAVSLGTLAAGDTVDIPVRYILNGPLLDSDGAPPLGPELLLPPLRLTGVVVPEPASAALLATGLVALAARRARRCA